MSDLEWRHSPWKCSFLNALRCILIRGSFERQTQKKRHTKENVTGSIPGLSRGLRIQRWPVGLGSSIAVSCGVGCRLVLDPALLWLWCRLAAAAPIGTLAWEPPYAVGVSLKKKKKKRERERERMRPCDREGRVGANQGRQPGSQAARQPPKLEEARCGLLRPHRKPGPAHPLIWASGLQNYERINSGLVKPPRLW